MLSEERLPLVIPLGTQQHRSERKSAERAAVCHAEHSDAGPKQTSTSQIQIIYILTQPVSARNNYQLLLCTMRVGGIGSRITDVKSE